MKMFAASASVEISAGVDSVWDALINPEIIKEYLYGFDAVSDWGKGSPIIFRGEYEGQIFEDKAVITAMEPNKLFSYSYWSPFFQTDDKPENYLDYTFEISSSGYGTMLSITCGNLKSEEEVDKQREGCAIFAGNIKKAIEGRAGLTA
jgi:uncharacterized protein YndB with AHSA1/START domain